METVDVLKCNGVSKRGIGHYNGGSELVGTLNFEKSVVEEHIVHDMESFLEDLDDLEDRLTISRMVSDSVIKGMVTAMSQEAADVVAFREQEVARLSKVSRCRVRNYGEFSDSELEICGEVEGEILSTIIHGLQEEYERRLWNADNVLAFIDRCKEISSIRRELDSVRNSLVRLEVGHLTPQGSLDADIFHRKVFNNHTDPGGVCEENGKCDEADKNMPESFEKSKLSHMSKKDLYQYFRTEIINMKRGHESIVHKMTEEHFTLKREYLKEREGGKEKGPFSARKDKEFESIKKKLSEVISSVDGILKENEKLSEFCNHSRETLNNLLSENCRLLELLKNKDLEGCHLSMQASDATEKLGQHLVYEENLQRLVGDLTVSLEAARLEMSISEEVYKCVLTDMFVQQKCDGESSDLMSTIMQEIIGTVYEEACKGFSTVNESDHEETSDYEETSELMSNLTQEVHSIVFQEVVADMSTKLNGLKNMCLDQAESLAHFEATIAKMEKSFCMEVEGNRKLKNEVLALENIIEDKDKSLYHITEELDKIMDIKKQQVHLIAERDEKLVLLQQKMEESHSSANIYMTEIDKLNDALSAFQIRLRESDEEKKSFISAFEQQQNDLDFVRAKERDLMKKMESFFYIIDGLSKSIANLELRTKESIGWQSSRLEHSAFQLQSLVQKVNILRRTSLLYKERLEKRSSDLQKAEAEVDVLGDEVDTLLRLLEKIYVALDHYSPVLEHYPGITEILKLVKRELSGEAVKTL